MARKEKLELDQFTLDDDLNFDEFDIGEIDGKINPEATKSKSRNPVTDVVRGTIGEASSKLTNPGFIGKVVKKALPDSYGEVIKAVDEVAETGTSLYDEAIRELKPQLSQIAKRVDRLVPHEQKFLKSITEKVTKIFGDETRLSSDNKEAYQDQAIQNGLAEIFGAQQEAQAEQQARDNAENRIQQKIESKRFRSNFGILSSINEGITRFTAYTEKVNQAYQKKSLELQYRSYFTQTQLLETTNKFFEVFKIQNEAITKNTALPEFVKINNSERFAEIAKGKFFDSVQESLFGKDSAIGRGMKRLKSAGKEYISGVKSGLEQGSFALDGIEQLQEMNKSLTEMGIDPMTKSEMLGQMFGAEIAKWAGDKASKFGKEVAENNPEMMRAGYKGANFVRNIPGSIDELRRSKTMEEAMSSTGIKGKLARGADWFMSLFGDEHPDFAVEGAGSFKDLNNTAIFNQKTQRSIVEVIPGFLSRILREITVLRTGDNKTALTSFNFESGKFMTKKELSADLRERLSSKVKSGTHDYRLDGLNKNFFQDQDITEDQDYKLKQFFSKLSAVPNMSYTPENIKKTSLFEALDSDTSSLVEKMLDARIGQQTDEVEAAKSQAELTHHIRSVRDSTSDMRGEIELFIRAGYGEILEQQGLVKRDREGNFEIDEDAYFDFVRNEGIARSDVNAKQSIKPVKSSKVLPALLNSKKRRAKSDVNAKQGITQFSPKEALAKIKKTKIYNSLYKLGKGDDKQHTGPMAQDVNQNLGEEAAPGGTSIDLVSMNGANMAAIQALDDQQKKLIGSKDSRTVLVGIKKDTGELVDIVKKGGFGFGVNLGDIPQNLRNLGNSYKDIGGNLLSTTIDLVKKVGGDVFDAGNKIFTSGRDKIAKPLGDSISKAYSNNKDRIGNAFKILFTKATDLAGSALDLGKKAITEKIPEGLKTIGGWLGKAKDQIYSWIQGPIDIYVKGFDKPFLRANLMEMGYYFDQATGKVIKSVEDIKGPVIDKTGKLVLSVEDIAKGLVDSQGKRIKGALEKVGQFLVGTAVSGFKKAKAFLSKAYSGISDASTEGWDKIKSWFSESSFSFGNDKIYDVLVEIRDIMRGDNPSRHEESYKTEKTSDGKTVTKRRRKKPSLKTKVQKKLKGFDPKSLIPTNLSERKNALIDKLKGKIPDSWKGKFPVMMDGVSDQTQSWWQQGKDKFNDIKNRITNKVTTSEETEESIEGDTTPRYKSGSNVIDNAMSFGSNLFNKAKDFKIDQAKEKLDKVKDKLGSIKKAKGLKGKAGAVFGSLFSGLKGGESSEEEHDPKKAALLQAKPGKKKKKTKTVTEKVAGKKQDATFNDRDGSGRRDGAWQDRIEENEKRRKANKKETLAASLDPRYKSGKNIIDTIMEKAGALFGLLGTGVTKIFGTASGVMKAIGAKGLLGSIGSVIKAPFTAAGKVLGGAKTALSTIGTPLANGLKAVKNVASIGRVLSAANTVRNIAMIGSIATSGTGAAVLGALGTGITALGSILASPVVLGAAAVAAVGYGAYKAYKYFTRNDVDEYEDIRIKQYGIGHSEDTERFNHYLLELEGYLCDGRVGYNGGQAYLIEKKLEPKEMLEMFSIDEDDQEQINKFTEWFNRRFKPFFLTHMTSLYSVNNKVQLKDVKDLSTEEKIKYLNLISFESGPYGFPESPFKDLKVLNVTPDLALNAIKALRAKLAIDLKKGAKKTGLKRIPQSPDEVKQSQSSSIKAELPKALPNTNIAVDKNKALAATMAGGEDGVVKDVNPSSIAGNTAANSAVGKVAEADGPMRDGTGADQFIKLQPGVKLDGLHPELLKNFKAMVQEYGESTGKSIIVTSGARSTAEQEALYRKYPGKAARPGRSLHEFGLALDVNSADLNEMDKLGLMRKYGFTRPVGGEPWHAEPAGIQVNIGKAKQDSLFATQAIEASLFKGGGGAAIDPNTPKGRRNQQLAISLLDAPTSKVSQSDKDAVSEKLAAVPVPKPEHLEQTSKTTTVKATDTPAANDSSVKVSSSYQQAEKYSKTDQLPVVESKTSESSEGEPKPTGMTEASDSVNQNSGDVRTTIADMSKKAGTDPNIMTAFAAVESSLNPYAKASTSSAAGLFQFTSDTWDEQLGKHARKYNLSGNESPTNPAASTLLASEYVKSNMRLLKSVKSDTNLTDVYLAHFLGPTGARKFLSADPDEIGAKILPAAARANQSIFYANGRALTVGEIYQKISAKLSNTAQQFGINLPASTLESKSSKSNTQSSTGSDIVKGDLNNKSASVIEPSSSRSTTPDSITKTDQGITQKRTSGIFTGNNAGTVIGGGSTNDSGQVLNGQAVESLGSINTTLGKSLTVQEEMRDILKEILSNVTSENLNDIKQGLLNGLAPLGNKQDRPTNTIKSPKTVTSTIDLNRKII